MLKQLSKYGSKVHDQVLSHKRDEVEKLTVNAGAENLYVQTKNIKVDTELSLQKVPLQ